MFYSPGSHSRQKGFVSLHTLESGLKIIDVSLEGRMADKPERTCTDDLLPPQVASTGKVLWELLGIAAIDPCQWVP
jgi:hypothetical protein